MRDLVRYGRADAVIVRSGAGSEMSERPVVARNGGTSEDGRSKMNENSAVLISFGQK
ncbi:MAG: hypothetical protein JW936_08650 [Sedimentisphaerales bacterium]|nr:hypothetical protein [Sedimentisphaerales bacterium]